jgi:signal peptidase
MKKTTFKHIVVYIVIALFFGFISYKLVSWFRNTVPWRTYVVQSGSMEPSIMTGDAIIIKKQPEYIKADVVTFKDENDRTVTHRIQEVQSKNPGKFVTKGDANQTADLEVITEEKVIGKVIGVIPKFGYIIRFIKSPWGFILCIITPTVLILYDELRSLIQALRKNKR